MCRPGKRVRAGDRVILGDGAIEGIFGELRDFGLRHLKLSGPESIEMLLERHGHIPLPPYIDRDDHEADGVEYQTVYAQNPGAVAAPTAGLHFTSEMFERLSVRGIQVEKITLHVGVGTFIPIRTEDPEKHVLKPERFEITEGTARRLNVARSEGRRIVAIGTTTTRTLEYVFNRDGQFASGTGEADLYILPGYRFAAVDALLTNFHLPRSTLLMLVSAFAGCTTIREAYRRAIELKYRFYSYGDCMLIVRQSPALG
jgi:S-adenosylmethionine:tRNA ribosyltransferase-isomerase